MEKTKAINVIKKFFEDKTWKYEYIEDDNVFISNINMKNILGNVRIFISISENSYNVYTILNSKVEKKYYPLVAEFLHRANYGLLDGNFEMDYNDGEIRYKSFVNFRSIDLTSEIVEESIIVGAAMMNRYGKGLLKIILGEKSVKECVEYCERPEGTEDN